MELAISNLNRGSDWHTELYCHTKTIENYSEDTIKEAHKFKKETSITQRNYNLPSIQQTNLIRKR